jgi:uncharacterized membrane protein YphA (DoxX/SURF4 family)
VKLPSSSVYAFWLAILRVYTGAFWLMHGIPKFTESQDFMPPGGKMLGLVNNAVASTHGPYHAFLSAVVVPNATLFAELVRVGEVVTGCLLFLGIFTRLGATIGLLMALSFLGAKSGVTEFGFWSGLDFVTLVLCAVNLVLPTGLVLGIDGLLARFRGKPQPRAQQAVFVDEPPMTGPTAPTA